MGVLFLGKGNSWIMNEVRTPVRRFEDLIAWQEARGLTREVYRLARETPLGRDFKLRDQMCDAAVSVMSNIAEGFERCGPNEFPHFLSIAKASCGELRSQNYVAFDCGYYPREAFEALSRRCNKVSRLTAALRTSALRRPSRPR